MSNDHRNDAGPRAPDDGVAPRRPGGGRGLPSKPPANPRHRRCPCRRRRRRAAVVATEQPVQTAAEAVREARGQSRPDQGHIELDVPQSRIVKATSGRAGAEDGRPRTQLLRGRQSIKTADFFQDPVVGWLVVVGGVGLGAFRPIFEGNNTVGRAKTQRIPIDFGDETISNEEQAYIRYDSVDRKFLLVPNLAKTNIVAVNDRKPTGAVELGAMDLITMGRTQLVFVPFCGSEFDWGELSEGKS